MLGLLLPLRNNLGAAPVTPAVVARGVARALPLMALAVADVVPFPSETADVVPLTTAGVVDVQPLATKASASVVPLTTRGTTGVIK